MVEALFGNKNIQSILLFLFVNGKGYGTQLMRLLNTPLTPIQHALRKLERGALITSYYEGKTRVYQLNKACPYIVELEQLLKKIYSLLPSQEKKGYCAIYDTKKKSHLDLKENRAIVRRFWERLCQVEKLSFIAKTHSKETGWMGRGEGEVHITKEADSMLIFHEKGTWRSRDGEEIDFSNVYRWSIDEKLGALSLEHLRMGWNKPVFLLTLAPSSPFCLTSLDSHLCDEDAYFGKLLFEDKRLHLTWRIIGPKKNEEIDCFYI